MELQFNIAAEKRVVEEISQLLISKDNVKTKPEKKEAEATLSNTTFPKKRNTKYFRTTILK